MENHPEPHPLLMSGALAAPTQVPLSPTVAGEVVPAAANTQEGQATIDEEIFVWPAVSKPAKKKRGRAKKKTSLEELLRHTAVLQHDERLGPIEARVPLPDSRPSSPNSTAQNDLKDGAVSGNTEEERSSLEMLVTLTGQPAPVEPSPESIPLPISRPETIREPVLRSLPQPDHRIGGYLYDEIIRTASIFPHIKRGHIHARSRRETAEIICVESHDNIPKLRVSIPFSVKDQVLLETLQIYPKSLKHRLIIVEDLSTSTIHRLGETFGITPEFFEEHLINSGYRGADYSERPSNSWRSTGMKKTYASIKWYRPVIRLARAPYTNTDLEDLLKPGGRVEYVSARSRNLQIFMAAKNIFRGEWPLWTNPKLTAQDNRVCGWEERASVWSKVIPETGCHVVILLLDPLPLVEEGRQRDELVRRIRQDSRSGDGATDSSYFSSRDSQYSVGAWDRGDIIIDEVTTVADPEAALKKKKKQLGIRRKGPERTAWAKFLGTSRGNPKQKAKKPASDESASSGWDHFGDVSRIMPAKVYTPKHTRSIFQQKGPRAMAPVFDFDSAFHSIMQLNELKNYLYDTHSTGQDFRQWLFRHLNGTENADLGGFLALLPMFQIIRQDSLNLLKVLNERLDEINVEILDETKMEVRLLLWRKLITRAQLELEELRQSMKQFFTFIQIFDTDAMETGITVPLLPGVEITPTQKATRQFLELSKQFDVMQRKLQAASALLTSNMALLDSRRSIAEAHAVSKLTELAFFFIPLTFAASLFGMQIEQLENRAPLSTFIILAFVFTAFAYLVRLTIRSNWLNVLIETYMESVSGYADKNRRPMQKGHVPASLFLRWVLSRSVWLVTKAFKLGWSLLLALLIGIWAAMEFIIVATLLVSVILVGPLAVLWTRPIAHDTKTIITVLVILLITPMIAIPYWRAADPEVRSALPRLIKRTYMRLRPRSRASRSLISVGVSGAVIAAIGAVPLALVWTRPLDRGIKLAVTITVVLIVVLVLVSYGIYTLLSVSLSGLEADSDGSGSSSGEEFVDD